MRHIIVHTRRSGRIHLMDIKQYSEQIDGTVRITGRHHGSGQQYMSACTFYTKDIVWIEDYII